MRQSIKLKESQLKQIITETVKKVLREDDSYYASHIESQDGNSKYLFYNGEDWLSKYAKTFRIENDYRTILDDLTFDEVKDYLKKYPKTNYSELVQMSDNLDQYLNVKRWLSYYNVRNSSDLNSLLKLVKEKYPEMYVSFKNYIK